MTLEPNEGSRPSLLELGRYATGELDPSERQALATRLDDEARATLAEMDAARSGLAPFDPQALRARGVGAAQAAPPVPRPANSAWVVLITLLVAVFAGVVLMPRPDAPEAPPEAGIRFRGGTLQLHTLEGDALVPWDGQRALEAGDVVGFKVDATHHEGVVLLSVDGSGAVTVFWPEGDVAMEPLRGNGQVPLPGTLILDDAPGPEVFLAVYDQPADEVEARVRQLHAAEGPAGLIRWAEGEAAVDALVVPRVR